MRIETISTFPQMIDAVMGTSIMHRAQEKGLVTYRSYDLRDWTHDRHKTTDDDPFGGGHGLVMKCEPVFEAYDAIVSDGDAKPRVIIPAPIGARFDDAYAAELAQSERLLFICGHYEGLDERIYTLADDIISVGDYVLTGGELASLVMIDAIVRKIPGVLGADLGAVQESFADGLLEYPQYTRPAVFRGMAVPDILLGGDHAKIAAWRAQQSLERTARLRPDLLQNGGDSRQSDTAE